MTHKKKESQRPKPQWIFLTAGFAMFSMFFGSGNLVFPLSVGFATLDTCFSAAAGLLVTGTLVPFLGLLALIFAGGSRVAFFAPLGRTPAFLVTFLILGILGPFGVCARCVLVSYGSTELIFPGLSLPIFSALFILIAVFMTLNRQAIVRVIGRYLTPLLLFGILLILSVGLYFSPTIQPSAMSDVKALSLGLHQGYQTMDLLAAFFFSATIVDYLKFYLGEGASTRLVAREAMKASMVGLSLLGLIYVGLVSLGAAYAPYLDGHHPENMLVLIAQQALGPMALPVIALTIVMACLTTLIILTSLFADFFQKDVCQQKISRSASVILAYLLCFGVSLIGFETLVALMGAILEYLYPALIGFSLFSIIDYYLKTRWATKAFYLALCGSVGAQLLL